MQKRIIQIICLTLILLGFFWQNVKTVFAETETKTEDKTNTNLFYPNKLPTYSDYIKGLPWVNNQNKLEENFIPAIMQFMMGSVGGIALTTMLVSGIMMVTSFGDSEKREKAKKALYWWVLGILFVFFAYLIVAGITKLQFNQ